MTATRPPAFDDRFSTPIEASRRGAHRARPKPVSAGLPVLAGVAVILLVLGGGYVMLRGNGVSESSSNRAAANAVDDGASPAPSKAAEATAPASDDAAGDEGDTPATKAPASGGKVDKDLTVVVLNSTRVNQLAKRQGDELIEDGWNVKRTGTSQNRGLATTKIYYGRASTKATASALGKALGFGSPVRDSSVLETSEVPASGIVVVLGDDAT